MGTTWQVKLVAACASLPGLKGEVPAGSAPGEPMGAGVDAEIEAAVQSILDDIVDQMSTWEPDSDISRFNRAPAGSRIVLPAAFARVLEHALAVARDSEGACDATVGAIVNAWGFGPGNAYRADRFEPPGEARLAEARACSGWRRLRFDSASRLAVQPGGLHLDFSAIAKGFAVDQIAAHLRMRGVGSYLVEVGGELRGAGVKPDGQPWWVALEPPGAPDAVAQTVVALHDLAVATSGDYRRYFERDGACFCHAIDPRTGRPVPPRVASVTVLHAECMAADALSTALMVMGPEKGIPWAERRGLAALFRLREPAHVQGIPAAAAEGPRTTGGIIERMTRAFAGLLQ